MDERCPVGAIAEDNELVAVDSSQCIGCGLCCSVCPTEALSMVSRDEVPHIPATGMETVTSVLTKKGNMEAFMQLNRE